MRDVVVMVTVAVAVPPAVSVTGDVTVQAAPVGGAPWAAQVSAILPAKPFVEVNFNVPVAVLPAVTRSVVDVLPDELSPRVKLGAGMPVPLSTAAGIAILAFDVTTSVPVREPTSVGVKTTTILHAAPPASDVSHVVVLL